MRSFFSASSKLFMHPGEAIPYFAHRIYRGRQEENKGFALGHDLLQTCRHVSCEKQSNEYSHDLHIPLPLDKPGSVLNYSASGPIILEVRRWHFAFGWQRRMVMELSTSIHELV